MIKKIKSLVNTEEKKRLLSNFFSLAVLQGANYILPLITFPYLVKVLGVEKFGLLSFATATIAYFNILTDYGFNLTATREVSIYRNDKEKLDEIFSSVMIIKIFLMIVSFLLLLILVYSFNKFKVHSEVFLLTFGMVIGQVLFPQWFFQGMERMKYITFLNILAKVIFTIAIFIFIHKSSDYIYVPLINSLGFIVAGVLALIIVFRDFKIKFKIQSFQTLKNYFIDGWHIFISQISISLFNNTNIIVLGLFSSNLMVGYYSIAEKIMRILSTLQVPITNTLYPYISNLIQKNKLKAYKFLCKILIIGSIVYVFILGFLFFLLPYLLQLILNSSINYIMNVFKIIGIIPLFVFINNISGTQLMLNLNMKVIFTKILISAAILNIILSVLLTYFFSLYGTAFALLIIEFYIMIMILYKIRKEFNCLKL